MFATFVIYYHIPRADNLRQTLRFLCKHESIVAESELVLVCQKGNVQVDFPFRNIEYVDLRETKYNKPKMLNSGVAKASSPVLVLLDSDRILPEGYFERAINLVKKNQCVSTVPLYKIERPCTDEQIESGDFSCREDFRSDKNELHRKNMFSGNTVMLRDDYCGMDESFVDYGYNDHDYCQTLLKRGVEFVWLSEKELHLHHPLEKPFNEFIRSNVYNGMRYCAKWGLQPTGLLLREAEDIGMSYNDVVAMEKAKKRRKLSLL